MPHVTPETVKLQSGMLNPTPVDYEQLVDVSEMLFDTGQYGDLAYDLVSHYALNFRGSAKDTLDGLELYHGAQSLGFFDVPATDQAAVSAIATEQFAARGLPFDITVNQNPYTRARMTDFEIPLQAGHTTLGGLKRFAALRGYARHDLHGSVGKCLDIINKFATNAPPRTEPVYNPYDYVPVHAIRRRVSESGTDIGQILSSGVYDRLARQLLSGQIPEQRNKQQMYEVVAEGPVRFTDGKIAKTNFSLSRDTLTDMARTQPRSRQAVSNLLLRIAEEYEA